MSVLLISQRSEMYSRLAAHKCPSMCDRHLDSHAVACGVGGGVSTRHCRRWQHADGGVYRPKAHWRTGIA